MRVLVFLVAIGTLCGTARAQGPVIKTGLWETTSTITMQMPAAVAERMKAAGMSSEPTTTTSKSCVTQEQIDKGMAFQQPRDNCTYSDHTVTPHGMTFTVTCTRPAGGTTLSHGSITADGPDKATAIIHTETSMPPGRGGGTMVTDIKNVGHFLGSDCGNVKPLTAPEKR